MFKIGDKVRVTKIIGSEDGILEITDGKSVFGWVGTVVYIHGDVKDYDNPVRVRFDEILDAIYFSPLELELVEKRK